MRPTDAVHARDHRGVAGVRRGVRQVAFLAVVGRVIAQLPLVFVERILRHLHRDVRHDERQVEEERLLLVLLDEAEGLRLEQVLRVLLAGLAVVVLQVDALVVAVDVGRVVAVGVAWQL